jgi:hypothetical protein
VLSIAHPRVPRPSPRAALVLALLLVAGPAAMVVEFGLLRDVPATLGCGDAENVAAEIGYQRGASTFVTLAEIVSLAVLLVALRRSAGGVSRVVDPTVILVAFGAGAATATVVVSSDATDAILAGLAAGVPAGIAVWLGLCWLAGRRPTWKSFGVAIACAPPLLAVAYVAALITGFATVLTLGAIAVAVAAAVASLFPRPTWSALAAGAGLFATVVVPAAGLIIFTRGHGPLAC